MRSPLFSFVAHAAEWEVGTCTGVDGASDVATIGGIKCLIQNFLGLIPPLLILGAVITIIFAGVGIISNGDNPKEYSRNMQAITFAIIGIVGLGAAWLILVLIEKFTGAPVTELNF